MYDRERKSLSPRGKGAESFALPLLFVLCWATPCRAEETPRLKGSLTPFENVAVVRLLDRAGPQEQVQTGVKVKESAVVFEAATGAFSAQIEKGKTYDLYVELKDGTKYEGVDLAPKLDAPGPFPDDGRADIEKHFYGMKQFTNENRILALAGNAKAAAALVELARTVEFHGSRGEVVYRVERWDYLEQYGIWQKDTDRVLRRFRWKADEWRKLKYFFVPEWGGLRAGGGELKLTIPAKEQALGRHPEMKLELPRPAPPSTGKKKLHLEDPNELRDPALGEEKP